MWCFFVGEERLFLYFWVVDQVLQIAFGCSRQSREIVPDFFCKSFKFFISFRQFYVVFDRVNMFWCCLLFQLC